MSEQGVSRQLRWRRDHIARGLCVDCCERAVIGVRCEKHAVRGREQRRGRDGYRRRNYGARSYRMAGGCRVIGWALCAVSPAQAEHERVVDQVLALSDPPNAARYRNYLLGLGDEVLRQKLAELTREREADPYHRRAGRSLRSVVRATPGVCA